MNVAAERSDSCSPSTESTFEVRENIVTLQRRCPVSSLPRTSALSARLLPVKLRQKAVSPAHYPTDNICSPFDVRLPCPYASNAHTLMTHLNASLFLPSQNRLCSLQDMLPSIPHRPSPILSDPIQRLHHNNRVTPNHAHSQSDLLVVRFALGCLVEDNVQEDLYIISFTSDSD